MLPISSRKTVPTGARPLAFPAGAASFACFSITRFACVSSDPPPTNCIRSSSFASVGGRGGAAAAEAFFAFLKVVVEGGGVKTGLVLALALEAMVILCVGEDGDMDPARERERARRS